MAERVVITGLGVMSSLGCAVEEFWSNLINGKSGISEISSFDTSRLERHYGGELKNFKPPKSIPFPENPARLRRARLRPWVNGGSGRHPTRGVKVLGDHVHVRGAPVNSVNLKRLPRSHQFALAASSCALKDSAISKNKDVGIALGSIVAGLEFLENKGRSFADYPVYMATARVCNTLGLEGPAFTVSGACAAGNYALSLAFDRIKAQEAEIMLAGGADYFSEGTFIGLYRVFSLAPCKCQPFDKNRRGLIPAEGAGILVVESLSSAKRRGAHIYAEILGYGLSADAYHPLIPLERGVFHCMENALSATGLSIGDIDYINAHGTGTVPNDKTECGAIKKLFGKKRYKKIPISSIKSMLGHAMGAASALESVACCLTLERGIIPPTINYETPDPECDIDCVPNLARKQKVKIILNNSFGFGGMNCSLVLAAYNQ